MRRQVLHSHKITPRAARVNAGLSLPQAAAALGTSARRLKELELNGRIRLNMGLRMTRLYQQPIDRLFWESEEEYHRLRAEARQEKEAFYAHG
ncbi:hypothetical protein [Paenibacillus herberti]|uniref:Transcriptional regulator n=1 Tax=Paenibacillus herberti TaxID=1619309 RepID=A0A229NZQ7_9BACL|nr:hypothetical protein [Paenibacillus herberti]OXM15443.1 transcriptional regulator [Paenibacillus herberti]